MTTRTAKSQKYGRQKRRTAWPKLTLGIGTGLLILAAALGIYELNRPAPATTQPAAQNASTGKYAFQVGRPGPGEQAPPIQLAATMGGSFDLSSQRGRIVLLYFQEGVGCQPCWDQIKDIESKIQQFRALGIDAIVSITTDPIDALEQKAADERLSTPILSDPDLAVSKAYDANSYGMMGKSRDGHTFVLIGRDGRILWRADYGGAPKYTMYLPAVDLLTDMLNGLPKVQ